MIELKVFLTVSVLFYGYSGWFLFSSSKLKPRHKDIAKTCLFAFVLLWGLTALDCIWAM